MIGSTRRAMASRGKPHTRTRRFGLCVALGTASLLIPTGFAAADNPPSPSSWPDNALVSARSSGAPNAIRFFGPDRSQTSLALALALTGNGGFPFTTPDPGAPSTDPPAPTRSWWGLDTCPRSVIIVAGDVAADALAASALSDPTGDSSEPFLERTAAADPLFDPIGGFARVDTDGAPILVTRSTRQGATALTAAARLAAQDMRSGGCTTARQAIVMGGSAAVPTAVESELISLGYTEVFRVAGANRYGTAAAVARSLGTAAIPGGTTTCVQPDASTGPLAMSFIANSVIEYRSSITSCRVLGRTVVVADGITGADALAAGWWTGFAQVPVVLHDGTAALPAATASYLATADIDEVIVLGGTARIPAIVLAEIAALTGTTPIRIAGADRYATSLEMAAAFGGWFSDITPEAVAGSMMCLAASSGDGSTARGWPDALSGGPWCGAATAAAGANRAPQRALLPINGAAPQTSAAVVPGRAAVPIILVPFGAQRLPASIATFVETVFDADATWCSSSATSLDCLSPGFAVLFGGSAAIGDSTMAEMSSLLAGGQPGAAFANPTLIEPFLTRLDLSPVYSTPGLLGVCVNRGGMVNTRWLAAFGTTGLVASADVFLNRRYVEDADGAARSPGVSAPVCLPLDAASGVVTTRTVGAAGRISANQSLNTATIARISLSGTLQATNPNPATGLPASDLVNAGGVSTRTFTTTFGASPPTVTVFGTSTPLTEARVTFTLNRGTPTTPTTVTGNLAVTTTTGVVTAAIVGEAVVVDDTWELRGRVITTGGIGAATAVGGFRATWTPEDEVDDETLSWRFDAARR